MVGDPVLPEHLVPLLYCFADTRGKESRKVIIVLVVTVTKMMPMTMRTRILNLFREHRIHNNKDYVRICYYDCGVFKAEGEYNIFESTTDPRVKCSWQCMYQNEIQTS